MNSKYPHLGVSIFSVMSELARQHQAINLSQGFPDFDCDPLLAELLYEASKTGHNQYAPMPGLPSLRRTIAQTVEQHCRFLYDWEQEITVCSGATEALFASIMALVRAGDEVIIVEPAYDSYRPAIEMAGGTPVPVRLKAPEYRIDWEELGDKISPKTRLLILNSPHNPSGKVLRQSDIDALHELIGRHPLLLISDEVYEHICFEPHTHLSISAFPALRKKAVVISSFGKSLHTTGWKVGYSLACPELSREIRKVHQFLTFSVGTPFQHAIQQYISRFPDRLIGVGPFYQRKRDLFLRLMEGSGFVPLTSEGTYFQLMDYSALSQEDDVSFARRLTSEYGVAVIPVSAFYSQKTRDRVVRFCFAKEDKTLKQASARLQKV